MCTFHNGTMSCALRVNESDKYSTVVYGARCACVMSGTIIIHLPQGRQPRGSGSEETWREQWRPTATCCNTVALRAETDSQRCCNRYENV